MTSAEEFRRLVRTRLGEVSVRIAVAAKKSGRTGGDVTLIAVTKSLPFERIGELRGLEISHFGENRPQDLARRQPLLPDASWHMIGHLQRNKVAQTLAHASLIHSVDSLRLLEEMEKESAKRSAKNETASTTKVLLQINGSREPQKGGFEPEELSLLRATIPSLKHVQVQGLMTMAAFSDDPETARPAFALVRSLRDRLAQQVGSAFHPLDQLSMGMSQDYEVAIEEGATMVRVGTALFEGFGS